MAGASGALLYALDSSVEASGSEVHPTKLPWTHDGVISSFDHSRYFFWELFAFVEIM